MRLRFTSGTAIASAATVILGPSPRSWSDFFCSSCGVISAMKTFRQRVSTPGITSWIYSTRFGNCSSNTCGYTSAVNSAATSLFRTRYVVFSANGVSHSDDAPVIVIATSANVSTGAITFRLGTPAARIAVISPSLDMRLSAINTPTNTPKGTVKVSVDGIASANRYPTVGGGAELRTRISNSLPTRCKNSTNVNSTVPSSALFATSRKIERLSRPIGVPYDPAEVAFAPLSGGVGTMG